MRLAELPVLGVGVLERGLAFSQWLVPPATAAACWWFKFLLPEADWQWDAFSATSAMSGFMLAALALIQAVASSSTKEVDAVRHHPSWGHLVRSVYLSMWMWMLAAVGTLAHWLAPGVTATALVGATMSAALLMSFRAMLFVTAVVRRFDPELHL